MISKSEPLISIIVPVYNTERYLSKCIDSILGQTYENIEVILVDDGSSDKCPQICDEYAGKDSRVKVIHKENEGVSSARNSGLDIAKGDFIGFVDSDDYVRIDMLNHLRQIQLEKQVDLICFGYSKESKRGELKEVTLLEKYYENVSLDASMELAFPGLYHSDNIEYLSVSIWNKLYKRDIIGKYNIRFDENLRKAEDLIFNITYLMNSKSIYTICESYYFYCFSEDSIMRSYVEPREIGIERSIYIFYRINELLRKHVKKLEDYDRILTMRLIRIVIDSNEDAVRNIKGIRKKVKAIRNITHWFKKYLMLYNIKLSTPTGKKNLIEYKMVRWKMTLIEYLYAKLMNLYHEH